MKIAYFFFLNNNFDISDIERNPGASNSEIQASFMKNVEDCITDKYSKAS